MATNQCLEHELEIHLIVLYWHYVKSQKRFEKLFTIQTEIRLHIYCILICCQNSFFNFIFASNLVLQISPSPVRNCNYFFFFFFVFLFWKLKLVLFPNVCDIFTINSVKTTQFFLLVMLFFTCLLLFSGLNYPCFCSFYWVNWLC